MKEGFQRGSENMAKGLITISEIVRRYGIPYSTVNYYTSVGLLAVADRKKNMRLYNEAQVKERLAKIAGLRSEGYPLHLIQKQLNGT